MQCYVCGNFIDDNQPYCPICGTMLQQPDPVYYEGMPPLEVQQPVYEPPQPSKPPRRKPHIALRIGMQFLSFVLCLILSVTLVATVLLADLHTLTSSGGIKQIIITALVPGKAPQRIRPVTAMAGLPMDPGQIQLPEGAEDAIVSGDSNAIVDILFDTMQDMLGEEIPITKEQLQTFVEESTVTDYIADKVAGYAEDFLNETETTEITAEELVQLVEDNKVLIEETFQVEITDEQMAEIQSNVITIVEENDINGTIRTEMNKLVEAAASSASSAGIPLAEIMQAIRLLSQDTVLYGAIGACALLLLLLCGANFYNIPGGLTWASVPCILIGALLSAPIAIVQTMPELLGEAASWAPMVGVLALNHYAVPAIGLALLIISIIWRIVRSCVRSNRYNP